MTKTFFGQLCPLYQENQATDSSHEGFVYNFKQNALTVVDAEPAP